MLSLPVDATVLKTIIGTAGSTILFYFAYERFASKAGISIRGSYSTSSSIDCDDTYIGRITLENLKDRGATIFAIYLKLGYNTYLLLEDFGASPLILKGYESYQKEFEPIEFYSRNCRRVSIDELISHRKCKAQLVLSTSRGKYKVRKSIRRWSPSHEFFKNHVIQTVYPHRSIFKGKAYGSRVIYVVELGFEDGQEQVIPIYEDDHEWQRYRNVVFSKESLESAEALTSHLNAQRDVGTLVAKSLKVHDLQSMRGELDERYQREAIPLRTLTAFECYVLGPILTRLSNWKQRRKNKAAAKEAERLKTASTPTLNSAE